MSSPIRLLIVDDHASVRDALSHALQCEPDFDLVGKASDGNDAVQLAQQVQPHIVLMDLRMPEMDGLEATRRIVACCPAVRVLGLSMDSADSKEMLAAGAAGCVDKASPLETLIAAIRGAVAGADR